MDPLTYGFWPLLVACGLIGSGAVSLILVHLTTLLSTSWHRSIFLGFPCSCTCVCSPVPLACMLFSRPFSVGLLPPWFSYWSYGPLLPSPYSGCFTLLFHCTHACMSGPLVTMWSPVLSPGVPVCPGILLPFLSFLVSARLVCWFLWLSSAPCALSLACVLHWSAHAFLWTPYIMGPLFCFGDPAWLVSFLLSSLPGPLQVGLGLSPPP